jgi:exportin-1
MVSQKVKDLKNQLCGEFSQVFQLCMLVLTSAAKQSLLLATLNTTLRFLNWIPLGYIFETDLIRILVEKARGWGRPPWMLACARCGP